MKNIFIISALIILFAGCSVTKNDKIHHLTILHTNDHHGVILPINSKGRLAQRSTYINSVILMSDDMQNKPINDKIDFIAQSAQALGINLTAQDLDIITSLFTIEDTKGNGVIATEGLKLAAQAAQGNQEAA